MITSNSVVDELDTIDWSAPTRALDRPAETAADRDPALFQFISTMADLITDDENWHAFCVAFDHYEKSKGRR
jgi:hypothetical protein